MGTRRGDMGIGSRGIPEQKLDGLPGAAGFADAQGVSVSIKRPGIGGLQSIRLHPKQTQRTATIDALALYETYTIISSRIHMVFKHHAQKSYRNLWFLSMMAEQMNKPYELIGFFNLR